MQEHIGPIPENVLRLPDGPERFPTVQVRESPHPDKVPGCCRMNPGVLALAGALVVFAVIAVPSVDHGRVRRRVLRSGERSRSDERPTKGLRHGLAAVGRSLAGGAVQPEDEALVGAAAFGLVAAVVVLGVFAGLLALLAVLAVIAARLRSRRRERQLLIDRGLPDVIDLLSLVVSAGRPVSLGFADVCPRLPEPYRTEFARVLRRSAAGEPFAESVRQLRHRIGPQVNAVVHAVVAAEMDGAPLEPALLRAGDEAQRRRRVRAEEAARRVPVAMLFPLVFCILPSFCLLTIVPVLLGSLAGLQLPG